jgi:hypothetical protein
METKSRVFIDTEGKIVAKGTISPQLIDLLLADGTRFFSTRSEGFEINFIKSLNISKIVKGA